MHSTDSQSGVVRTLPPQFGLTKGTGATVQVSHQPITSRQRFWRNQHYFPIPPIPMSQMSQIPNANHFHCLEHSYWFIYRHTATQKKRYFCFRKNIPFFREKNETSLSLALLAAAPSLPFSYPSSLSPPFSLLFFHFLGLVLDCCYMRGRTWVGAGFSWRGLRTR